MPLSSIFSSIGTALSGIFSFLTGGSLLSKIVIAGLSIAMAGMLWANRLLPLGLAQRAEWEVHAFFIVWGATLAWALLRPARRAWIELLWTGAAALALLPLLNALTTDRGLLASLRAGDWIFAGLELTLLALAALHVALAIRTARHKPKLRPQRQAAAARRPAAPPPPDEPVGEPALQEAAR